MDYKGEAPNPTYLEVANTVLLTRKNYKEELAKKGL